MILLFGTPAAAVAQRSVSVDECAESVADDDQDGLGDACEFRLARSFAPMLVVRSGGCNWDRSVSPARLGGGYRFAVQRVDSTVRIAYLPAYFHDCGWAGLKCWLPGVDCAPHAGDSEFIVIELRLVASTATVTGVFLSAHCFGKSAASCRWYRGQDLNKFVWTAVVPTIWVAEGRQANYPSAAACDKGHHSVDTCDHHDARYRFPVVSPNQNIGSQQRPQPASGCISGRELEGGGANSDAEECFWQFDTRFRGWQPGAHGVTGYWRYLNEIAGFAEIAKPANQFRPSGCFSLIPDP